MPAAAWASDLERLKRELTQRIDRMSTDMQNAQRTASRNDPTADLTRRLDALERRLQTTIDQINRTVTDARGFDDRLGTRIGAVETRVQTTIDQINRTVTSARAFDDRLSGRIDTLERRITELARNAERSSRS